MPSSMAARGLFRRACLLVLSALALCALPASASAALSWGSAPVNHDASGTGPVLTGVSCPTASQCTALTVRGGAVTFDPGSPGPQAPVSIESSAPTAVTCPASSLCVAVDISGQEVTFNPASPTSASTATIDTGQILLGVACVADTSFADGFRCVAVDGTGNAVSFDPGAPSSPTTKSVDGGNALNAVACPALDTCVGVDNGGRQVTFDARTLSVSSLGTLDTYQSGLNAVVCLSSSRCLAFDGKGNQISFVPHQSSITLNTLDLPGNSIIAAACPSSSQCVALDAAGNEISFPPGGHGTLVPIDPSQKLTALACASAGSCTAVNANGQSFGFAPGATSGPPPVLLDALPSYQAVGCATDSQCTAADQAGDQVTFNPQTGASVAAATVDVGGGFVYGISCPAATQCTLIDGGGREATFNPQSSAGTTPVALVTHHPLLAISCPSTTQCTAVDDDQYEVTFNPQSPGSPNYAALGTPAGTSLTGVACPAATQCTAVDGAGNVVSFNPQAPGAPKPVKLLGTPGVAVACPSTSECVAADAGGSRTTFDPHSTAGATTAAIDGHQQPAALQCMGPTYCTMLDTAGHMVEFDPHGWSAPGGVVASSGSITGLGCSAPATCVVVDSTGYAFAGSATLPPLPVGVTGPRISGPPRVTAALASSGGTWSNNPTSVTTQWERCAPDGSRCLDIPGATAYLYRPTAADAGYALRARATAANQAGYATPAISAPTGPVVGLPAGPLVAAALRAPKTGRIQISMRLTSARWGPSLQALTLSLPAGISFTVRPRSIVATSSGRPISLSTRLDHGRLVLRLRRAVTALQLVLRAPGLRLSSSLTRALARRRHERLWLGVALQARPKPLSTRALVTVTR